MWGTGGEQKDCGQSQWNDVAAHGVMISDRILLTNYIVDVVGGKDAGGPKG